MLLPDRNHRQEPIIHQMNTLPHISFNKYNLETIFPKKIT